MDQHVQALPHYSDNTGKHEQQTKSSHNPSPLKSLQVGCHLPPIITQKGTATILPQTGFRAGRSTLFSCKNTDRQAVATVVLASISILNYFISKN